MLSSQQHASQSYLVRLRLLVPVKAVGPAKEIGTASVHCPADQDLPSFLKALPLRVHDKGTADHGKEADGSNCTAQVGMQTNHLAGAYTKAGTSTISWVIASYAGAGATSAW
jgi:hypothetical protein